jgi:hypothetical protein
MGQVHHATAIMRFDLFVVEAVRRTRAGLPATMA